VRAGYSSLRQNVREVGLLDERSSCPSEGPGSGPGSGGEAPFQP
jgi:hypothetical protein